MDDLEPFTTLSTHALLARNSCSTAVILVKLARPCLCVVGRILPFFSFLFPSVKPKFSHLKIPTKAVYTLLDKWIKNSVL